jgi:predicted ester cyclase
MPSEESVSLPAENKIVVIRFYEIINSAKYDQLDSILDQHVVWHDPLLPVGDVRGSENFKNVLRMFRSAFPDLHITIQDQIVERDKVATRFNLHGTNKGDLMGVKATGKQFTVTGHQHHSFVRRQNS